MLVISFLVALRQASYEETKFLFRELPAMSATNFAGHEGL